jgi:hypothetical protein
MSTQCKNAGVFIVDTRRSYESFGAKNNWAKHVKFLVANAVPRK